VTAFAAWSALFQRDIRAVIRSRAQLYSSILTPLLFLVFLGNGVSHGLAPSKLPAGDFTSYLVAGTVAMTSVFSSTFASASFYRDRDTGILRVFFSSPHSPRTILLGKSLAGVCIGMAQALLVTLVAAPFVDFGWQYGIASGFAAVVLTVLLLNLFLAGFAQALASRIQTMQGFHLLMNLALFPLLFFSGAFYPVDDLPRWLEILARGNPLTYAVDAIEVVTYANNNNAFYGLWIDFPVLAICAAAVYVLGLVRVPRLTWSGK